MPKVLFEMSMSLDGHTTGPDVSLDEPMARGGESLHQWMSDSPGPLTNSASIWFPSSWVGARGSSPTRHRWTSACGR